MERLLLLRFLPFKEIAGARSSLGESKVRDVRATASPLSGGPFVAAPRLCAGIHSTTCRIMAW